ncbi:glycine betaine ABC transporter substrate-binding protein [Thiohalocapsa halophila]
MRHRTAILSLLAALAVGPAGAEDDGIISIGWTAWGDAEVVSKLAAVIIGQGISKPVELTLADIDVQYRKVAEGNLDLMLMSWQPQTHADYLARWGEQLRDLGPLYEGARLGSAVPGYVPAAAVATPADLSRHAQRFGRRILGIDPGAGLMRRSRALMQSLGLDDWTLTAGTGPLMARTVLAALDNGDWVVATLWSPHWLFAETDLRYLDDPQGVFQPPESVHALARPGFEADYPAVAGFIRRFSLELADVEAMMAAARAKSHKQAVRDFIAENRDRVAYWMSGER